MTKLYNEDCLEGMKRIPDGAVDFILTDLPFGITAAHFDKRLPFAPMWEQFKRVTKRNAAIALFANGRFLIELTASNLRDYRYKWIWRKNSAVGFLNAKKMPLKTHEDILIFYRMLPTYNPQFTRGKPYKMNHSGHVSENYKLSRTKTFHDMTFVSDGARYPKDELRFNQPHGVHPQQKPVELLEYLIKTYTNEGETVLDATMGSGSTGVAAVNTDRNFIGFETDKNFFDIATKRIEGAIT